MKKITFGGRTTTDSLHFKGKLRKGRVLYLGVLIAIALIVMGDKTTTLLLASLIDVEG